MLEISKKHHSNARGKTHMRDKLNELHVTFTFSNLTTCQHILIPVWPISDTVSVTFLLHSTLK